MRLAERQKIAAKKAKAIMLPDDFAVLSAAIVSGAPVKFTYTDRYGDEKKYKKVHPLSFFETLQDFDWPGSVLLWSRHELHSKKEQYRVERIFDVKWIITLLDALLDPSTNAEFWYGPSPKEKVISAVEQLLQNINAAADVPDKDAIVLEWLETHMSPKTTILYDGNIEGESEVYHADIGGVRFYFGALDEPALVAARSLIELISINPLLLVAIPAIHVTSYGSPYAFEAKAIWDHDLITVLEDNLLDLGSLVHETGHAFAYNTWGDPRPPEGSGYKGAIDSGEPPPSDYAKLDNAEDFAEAVRMFVADPAGLKKIAPLRYNVIKRLMEDEKYGG